MSQEVPRPRGLANFPSQVPSLPWWRFLGLATCDLQLLWAPRWGHRVAPSPVPQA